MTVRDNPVKRILVVQKIDGKLVIDIQGTVHVPIELKLRPVSAQRQMRFFQLALSKWDHFIRQPYRGNLAIKLRLPGLVHSLPNRTANAGLQGLGTHMFLIALGAQALAR